jgi:DNA-binding MarR family transcriptional regulator
MNPTLPDPGAPNATFERPADTERLKRTAAALEQRGFVVRIADDRSQARELALELVPEGAEVYSALSETLRELGITEEIDESGRYDALRPKLRAMDRQTQGREMRKLGAAPDVILGSAHAITDDGQILVASGSGSQLGAYAYTASSVVLIVGHQKLVKDIEEGLRRIREYSLPKEYLRMQTAGLAGTLHAQTLILHMDPRHRVHVIFVPETLGF